MWKSLPFAEWAITWNSRNMIKRLRIVFITVTMILVAVMLATIFLLIIQTTYVSLSNKSLQVLEQLDRDSFRKPWPDFPDPLPKNCFILTLQVDGVIKVTAGYADIPDEMTQRYIFEQVRKNELRSGVFQNMGLRYYRMDDPENLSYAFIDITESQNTLRTLVLNCAIIGVITLVLCFPVSWMLARSITRPAEESLAQQRQFLADASHELKTPLTVIITNAELLQSTDYSFQDKQRFASAIHSVSKQMRGMVEDMLNLARIENNIQEMVHSQVSISDMAEECSMLFEPVFYESGRELGYSVEPDLWIWGNDDKIQQLIDILLDNANKYSSPGSRVMLRVQKVGRHCQLQVISRGNVLTHQQCRDIFKRFYRVDESRTGSGSQASYGLGLPIAQQIVREYRGKIWCVGKDGCNTFYVQFPLSHN